MFREKYKLEWQTFQDHSVNLNKELYNEQNFTDVTLVTDDLVKTPAHKVILSAASSVFKELCTTSIKGANQVLFLRGVKQVELEAILQFIYLGQATFYQERMNEFLNVGKSLEIKEISKDVEAPGNEQPDDVQSSEFEEEIFFGKFNI